MHSRSEASISRASGTITFPANFIDIHVEVPRVPFEKLSAERRGEPSDVVRQRVEAARAIQAERFEEMGPYCNEEMGPSR